MKKITILVVILFLFFLPSVTATIPQTNTASRGIPNWGFIVCQDYDLYTNNFGHQDSSGKYWGIDFRTKYHVIGFGRHTIRCVTEYDVYLYDWLSEDGVDFDTILHWNHTKESTENIWLFHPFMRPHFKPRAIVTFSLATPVCINGTVHSKVFIDDNLVWEETLIQEDVHFQNPYIFATTPVNDTCISILKPECKIHIAYVTPPPINDMSTVDVYWYENSTGSWVLRHTDHDLEVGQPYITCRWTYTQAKHYDRTYWWKVSVDDGINNVTKTYHFTTKFSWSHSLFQSSIDVLDLDATTTKVINKGKIYKQLY